MNNHHHHKRLIVVEGPAGAGKTTVIKSLLADFASMDVDAEVIEYPWRDPARRSFEGLIGASEALSKDYYRMVKAIATVSSGMIDVVILDRCFISQFVYNRLVRAQGGRPTPPDLAQYMTLTTHLVGGIPRLMELQGIPQFKIPYPVEWVFVCPEDAAEIDKRRKGTGKEYPYSASAEMAGFAWVWHYWDRARASAANLYTAEPLVIDGVAETDQLTYDYQPPIKTASRGR